MLVRISLLSLLAVSVWAQAPGGIFGVGGSSGASVAEYPATFTSTATVTVSGATHGRGFDADVSRCENAATPRASLAFTRTRDVSNGNIVITLTGGSATGTCYIGATNASATVVTTDMLSAKLDKPGAAGVVKADVSGNSSVVTGTSTNCVRVDGSSVSCGVSTVAFSDVTGQVQAAQIAALPTHTHAGADIASGTVAAARLGSGVGGTPGSKVLYDDNTWKTPSGGGGGSGSMLSGTLALMPSSCGTNEQYYVTDESIVPLRTRNCVSGVFAQSNWTAGPTTGLVTSCAGGYPCTIDINTAVVSTLGNSQTITGLKTFSTAPVMPAGYFKEPCEVQMFGSGTSGVLVDADDPLPACSNKTGATETITSVECYANAGSPTVAINVTGGSSILSTTLTCGTASWAAGTLSGTPTIANNGSLSLNFTGDATATGVAVRIGIQR